MNQVIAYLAAILITMPIPLTIIVYLIMRKTVKNKKKSLHMTVNSMTVIYVLAVPAALFVIFERSYISYVFILLLLLLSLFIYLQWKVRDEIEFRKAFKGFWRFSFLLFAGLHISLTIYGLANRLMTL
ncbi:MULTISPECIES: DUF3397 domain-containing protein [Pontibacillus]|uniref:DUF3397 domain-containing protein n=1 Tax=Pontibacillus chungwhensis TaxID=265426 RepID=A0ABY8V5L5_9BACI|nr:DUF3397 domain-containing protein [Pontibacillus chungwhensis]MCD5322581.1 DUF3397 domain-containing protein [Pontibacillus sp. HN14]WIF99865.1 DUF3397 domain-containing protein [Pontibacillus chungwhensis]